MGHLVAEPVKTQGNKLAFFVTGLGQNGSRPFTVLDGNRKPINLTGKALKFVVKTELTAADTELDSNFPLTPTIVVPLDGTIAVDMVLINFITTQKSVFVVLAEVVNGVNVPIAYGNMFIEVPGIARS